MEKFYTLKETAEILNVKLRTIRLWVEKKKINIKKYPGSKFCYVSEKEIERIQGDMR